MSSPTFNAGSKCARCGCELYPNALECPQCRSLVHSEEMERLAAQARSFEARGDFAQAREQWLLSLALLPPQSPHAAWIRDHVRELESGTHPTMATNSAPGAKSHWAQKLGPLGPIALGFWKLKFLWSLVAFIGVYWSLWGWKFGVGFALLILVHEMGHFIDIKRRGLPADMPMFLPGLGAYVRWNAMGVPLETRAAVSLAGPLAGWFASAVCAVMWFQTHDGIWAALARTSAWLNALNLIPLWIFDGSKGLLPLNRLERFIVLLVGAAFGYAIQEWVFAVVAVGAGIRLFTHDVPREGSNTIAAYFVALLTALAGILWLIPGRGLGLR